MERDGRALGLGHDPGLALGASDHALHRLLDLIHADAPAVAAGGEQRGLVHEVRKVGTGESHGELGELIEAHVVCKRLVG